MPKQREEHCSFAVIDQRTGKCIADCHRQDGDKDCIGIKSLTPAEYAKALELERRLH
jgi:hypothetical protein